MSHINITLELKEAVELFSKDRNEAFTILMQKTLNAVLLAESDEQIGAAKHERSDNRKDYRNGTRERDLAMRIGTISLRVPRHRDVPFETMIFDNFQRSEAALISTMAEMVVQGVSTRKVSNVVEELCGTSFSKSTVSELCKELDEGVQQFKERPLNDVYPFVMVDAKYMKVRDRKKHRIVSKAFMVAIGITMDGMREVIGFGTFDNESKETWTKFLSGLKARGLKNMDMLITDCHSGLIAAIKAVYPQVAWQRCQFHFQKNILDKSPKKYVAGLTTELREMFTAETIEEARKYRDQIYDDYKDIAPNAMEVLDDGFEDVMTVMMLPEKMRRPLRTTNIIERENGEIDRRYRVIRIFPNDESMERLMGAVLIERHDLMATRHKLFSQIKYAEAIKEAKPKLLEIAQEQIKLLMAS